MSRLKKIASWIPAQANPSYSNNMTFQQLKQEAQRVLKEHIMNTTNFRDIRFYEGSIQNTNSTSGGNNLTYNGTWIIEVKNPANGQWERLGFLDKEVRWNGTKWEVQEM